MRVIHCMDGYFLTWLIFFLLYATIDLVFVFNKGCELK